MQFERGTYNMLFVNIVFSDLQKGQFHMCFIKLIQMIGEWWVATLANPEVYMYGKYNKVIFSKFNEKWGRMLMIPTLQRSAKHLVADSPHLLFSLEVATGARGFLDYLS